MKELTREQIEKEMMQEAEYNCNFTKSMATDLSMKPIKNLDVLYTIFTEKTDYLNKIVELDESIDYDKMEYVFTKNELQEGIEITEDLIEQNPIMCANVILDTVLFKETGKNFDYQNLIKLLKRFNWECSLGYIGIKDDGEYLLESLKKYLSEDMKVNDLVILLFLFIKRALQDDVVSKYISDTLGGEEKRISMSEDIK